MEDLSNIIFSITAKDRKECLNKIAEALGADIGDHDVFTGRSKNIIHEGNVIDITFRKGKVDNFSIYPETDRSKIRFFWRD